MVCVCLVQTLDLVAQQTDVNDVYNQVMVIIYYQQACFCYVLHNLFFFAEHSGPEIILDLLFSWFAGGKGFSVKFRLSLGLFPWGECFLTCTSCAILSIYLIIAADTGSERFIFVLKCLSFSHPIFRSKMNQRGVFICECLRYYKRGCLQRNDCADIWF